MPFAPDTGSCPSPHLQSLLTCGSQLLHIRLWSHASYELHATACCKHALTSVVVGADAARDARGRWCPEEQAGFFSTIFYSYATSLVTLGYKKTLLADDLWDMSHWDEARTISSRIHGCLETTKDSVTAPKVCPWRC